MTDLVVRKTSATPSAVREWARENGFETGKRGRYSSQLVAAYNQAHKGSQRYVPQKGYPVAVTEVKVGNKTRKVPVAEARKLLAEAGEPIGRRGRVSEAQMLRALTLASQ